MQGQSVYPTTFESRGLYLSQLPLVICSPLSRCLPSLSLCPSQTSLAITSIEFIRDTIIEFGIIIIEGSTMHRNTKKSLWRKHCLLLQTGVVDVSCMLLPWACRICFAAWIIVCMLFIAFGHRNCHSCKVCTCNFVTSRYGITRAVGSI